MEWTEFVVAIADQLAWPIVVVVCVLTFHEPLSDILRRVTGVKAPGVEINMTKSEDSLDAARASVEPEVAAKAEALAAGERHHERLEQDDALHDPTGVILRSWRDLSDAIFALRRANAGRGRPAKDIKAVLAQLAEDKILSEAIGDSVLQLRDIRNDVAHGTAPSGATAQAYAINAEELLWLVKAKGEVTQSK